MRLEIVNKAIKDIEDFYSEPSLMDMDVNTYVRIYSCEGKHLSSSYYATLSLRGRNVIKRRGKYINNKYTIGHQFNHEWERKFHITDISRIHIKFLYGDKSIEKVYDDSITI